jgi:hypothetical protein
MVWIPVAVGAHIYMLDERRSFVGHGANRLLIACEKLHVRLNNKAKHVLWCLVDDVGMRRSLVA